MARPPKSRRCPSCPGCRTGAASLRILGADEAEALRLADILGLQQVEAAGRMGVSQSTFQRILARARKTAAEAVVLEMPYMRACAWDSDVHAARRQTGGTAMTTRIALVTDDGTTLMPHFGRARYYKIIDIEDGRVTHTELRDKFAHQCGGQGEQTPASAETAHASMVDGAAGCEYVIAGGMGPGAYNALTEAGLKVLQTEETDLETIIRKFADGTLVNQAGRIHCDHGAK